LKKILFLSIFILLSLSACAKPLATAGNQTITQNDLNLQRKALQVSYQNTDMPEAVALGTMLRTCVMYEIMKSHGIPVTDDDLIAEERRIDENTKEPETLEKIKMVFASKRDYRRLYIYSVLVPRVFSYSFARYNSDVQKGVHDAAESYLQKAIAAQVDQTAALFDTSNSSVVLITAYPDKPWTVKAPDTLHPENDSSAPQEFALWSESDSEMCEWAERFYAEIIQDTDAPSLLQNIVELPSAYHVVYLKEKRDESALLESRQFVKKDSNEVFAEEAPKVPVIVHNKVLLNRMRETLPWSRSLINHP